MGLMMKMHITHLELELDLMKTMMVLSDRWKPESLKEFQSKEEFKKGMKERIAKQKELIVKANE